MRSTGKKLIVVVIGFTLLVFTPSKSHAGKKRKLQETDYLTRIETIIDGRSGEEAAYLRKVAYGSPFPSVRARAIGALLLLFDDSSEKLYLEKLKGDPSPLVRRAAAYAFTEIKSKIAISALIEASTGDSDSMVRAISCRAIGFQGIREPGNILISTLISDSSYEVRVESAVAISNLKIKEGIEPLKIAVLTDPEKQVKIASVRALSTFRDEEILEFLAGEFETATDSDFRFELYRGIISFRGTSRYMEQGLIDGDERIRFLALKTVTDAMFPGKKSFSSSSSVALLEEMLKDPFKGIRDLANDTLKRMGYRTKDLGVRYEIIR